MNWKKISRALLFPHAAVVFLLLPFAVVFLVYSLLFMGTDSWISYISYVVAFYTLMVWCLRIPVLIRFFKNFKNENKYVRRWQEDARLRVNISLYGSLLLNVAYAVFQFSLGLYHASFWYYSMAGYYISLAVMRFFLAQHTRRHQPGEKMREELIKYRRCGVIFLVMNLYLSFMVFFMVYWNRTFVHHEITTIAMAAYTFASFTVAIVNVIKYRKYNSPVFSASKTINLAAASVSMLTLESTMLTTFDDGTLDLLIRRLLLAISGGVISVFVMTMAVYMIVQGNKKIKLLKIEE